MPVHPHSYPIPDTFYKSRSGTADILFNLIWNSDAWFPILSFNVLCTAQDILKATLATYLSYMQEMPSGLPEQKYTQNKMKDLNHWLVYSWRAINHTSLPACCSLLPPYFSTSPLLNERRHLTGLQNLPSCGKLLIIRVATVKNKFCRKRAAYHSRVVQFFCFFPFCLENSGISESHTS